MDCNVELVIRMYNLGKAEITLLEITSRTFLNLKRLLRLILFWAFHLNIKFSLYLNLSNTFHFKSSYSKNQNPNRN